MSADPAGSDAATLDDLRFGPTSDLSSELLARFLAGSVQEGFSLDYKKQVTRDLLKTIAAMANTYGGVVIVGVEEDRAGDHAKLGYPGEVRGVEPSDRARVVNMCRTSLQPPLSPDVVAVPSSGERVLLIIRVEVAPVRPVIYDGRVMVRTDEGNVAADWFRIKQLFDSDGVSHIASLPHMIFNEGLSRWQENPKPQLAITARASFPLMVPSARHRIEWSARSALAGDLDRSSVTNLLAEAGHTTDLDRWRPVGHSTATEFQLRWWATRGATSTARLTSGMRIAVPPSSSTSGLTVTMSVEVRRTLPEDVPEPVTGRSLAMLINALLAFYFDVLPVHARTLAGGVLGPISGPAFALRTSEPINDVVAIGSARPVSGNDVGHGCEFYLYEDLRPDRPEERRELVRRWLEDIVMDNHMVVPPDLVDGWLRELSIV